MLPIIIGPRDFTRYASYHGYICLSRQKEIGPLFTSYVADTHTTPNRFSLQRPCCSYNEPDHAKILIRLVRITKPNAQLLDDMPVVIVFTALRCIHCSQQVQLRIFEQCNRLFRDLTESSSQLVIVREMTVSVSTILYQISNIVMQSTSNTIFYQRNVMKAKLH